MSDQSLLTSREVVGKMYLALEDSKNMDWGNRVGMYFESNQPTEKYKWLGMSPMLREWIGGRQVKSLRGSGVDIENKDFEATIEVHRNDLRRDKTGQLQVRIDDLARRANQHWNSLLTTLIINGESTACYDGQFFFDTDHSEGDSGTQSNDLSSGVFNVTTPTAPTAAELVDCILEMIQAIYGFKDDQGEPLNEGAREFGVMVPIPFWGAAQKAVSLNNINVGSGVQENALKNGDFRVSLIPNPRLTWTTKLAVFRLDGVAKPFILQEEEKVKIEAVAEGSELEFNTNMHHYGVRSSRNVGYGFWQHAVLATLS